MQLRDYQRDAIRAAYDAMREGDSAPCIVLPTGSGKTPVMGEIVRHAMKHGRTVTILAHVRELLEQTEATIKRIAPEYADAVGVYCAGLKRRDTDKAITLASIQSVHRTPRILPRPDLVMIDEAHLIPPSGEGMYRRYLTQQRERNPRLQMLGLTATPYRLGSGYIYGRDRLFDRMAYEAEVADLIAGAWLCPLVSKAAASLDASKLHKRHGEYIAAEADALMRGGDLVADTVRDMLARAAGRNAGLIFATSIDHGEELAGELRRHGEAVAEVYGHTPPDERADTLRRFKDGDGGIRWLVNMGVLTTGFDATRIDCIALIRPTASPGLYCQMVGRGLRLDPRKTDCLILDYGGNIERHGPLDAIQVRDVAGGNGGGSAPVRVCPQCQSVWPVAIRVCADCGYEWPAPEVTHDDRAADAPILAGDTIHTMQVHKVVYSRHPGKGGKPDTLRVEYRPDVWRAYYNSVSEYLCFDHPAGFAFEKATKWWRFRQKVDTAPPGSVDGAMSAGVRGDIREPIAIRYRYEGKWPRVVGYVWGDDDKATR